jgi:CDP-4-dehydro-6-deoxyglucose reductase, E3
MAKVSILNSGHHFEVRPSQTVLEAAIEAGINLPYGCRNGTCGACKGKVVSGKVMHDDYQPSAMSEEELENGQALFCCARPLEDLIIECREVNGLNGLKPRILPARVQQLQKVSEEVIVMFLQLPATEKLQFVAGQYLEFILKDGNRRAFSIANAPHDNASIELHLRLVAGGQFTEYVFNELQEKAIMRIEAPLGTFFLREDSQKPIIFVAGGTGFAPVKGIIEHLIHQNSLREIILYRGAKTEKDLYMDMLCQRWATHLPNLTYNPVLSDEPADSKWAGKKGLVHQAVLDDFADLSAYQVYACGAPAMVEAAQKTFIERGLNQDEFFSDAFTFAPKKLL